MLLAQLKKYTNEHDEKVDDWWRGLLRGDKKALTNLFETYHHALYNYGIKIVADKALVDESIQELFLQLWRRHNQLSTAHSVKAYLLASLRRLLLKRMKQREKRSERNRKYVESQGEISFSFETLRIREEVTKEQREQLQSGLDALTPRQREAVFLKYYHGLSNNELVEVLEINHQSIRNLLYHAIKRLRNHVEIASY